MMKRGFDFVLSVVGLILLFPLLGLIALSIRLASGRPVLFRQVRVGKDGRTFTLLKFRTMTAASGRAMPEFEPGRHDRIFPVGRFLRKTKLDELPQLLNVVKGDMALVGPRPEVPKWVKAYPERWAAILRVRPGITDPASLAYRREEEILASASEPEASYRNEVLPHKLMLYERYIESRGFFSDLGIIVRTLSAMIVTGGKRGGGRR